MSIGPSRKWIFLLSLLLTLTFFPTERGGQIQAEEKYPTRGIDILVPWSAGGASDLSNRVTAEFLKKRVGHTHKCNQQDRWYGCFSYT